ncbi:hypothetical protein WJX82_011141 [Trebouxia sp. C0006]
MAGLAAARQLDAFGYKVIIVDGHGQPGGWVYTKQLKSGDVSAVADLGGSTLTGIDGNPLAVLAKQLHIPLHVIDEADVPLYHDDGWEANTALDQEIEKKWNDLLDECSQYRDAMGEVADNISLGTALETLWATMEEEVVAAEDLQHLRTVKAYEAILATKRENIERPRAEIAAREAFVVKSEAEAGIKIAALRQETAQLRAAARQL